nr:hypothetical protein [Tanacetum cinerariifolium]
DNDVTRLQALVDKKKVVVTEAAIRELLWVDDAEGVDCLPNEEIFAELARMGYEKPSIKLTFYKAFFSSQWKFLIHTILQSMSAKHTSWNEFSSAMASAVICLSTCRKFKFSKYIFDSLDKRLRKEEMQKSMLKMLLLVMLLKEMILLPMEKFQLSHKNHPYHLLLHLLYHHYHLKIFHQHPRRVEHLEYDKVAQALEITKLKRRMKKLEKGNRVRVLKLQRLKKIGTSYRIDTFDDTVMDDSSNQGRIIDELNKDDVVALMDDKEEDKKEEKAKVVENDQVQGRQAESQAEIYKIDMDHASKVLSMQEDEPAEVHEVVDVVTTAKLITEVVTTASETVTAASTIISAAEPQVPAATITVAPVRVVAAPRRRRKGVPLKKKQQVEMDEEYARKLHAELNKYIDCNVAIDYVKLKAKEDQSVQRYQAIKRKSQTEAQAQRNMIMYLKNVAGFRLDYFKGMSYDDICPIFESINETLAQKAAKRRKLNKEVEDLKRHLEIVADEDDDVYTEATPLARKVLVVDYVIIDLNNKPHYKIIRADGTHQLFISFLTLLKNFDREDLEALWNLVKERCTGSSLEESKDYTWLSKGQELEANGIMRAAKQKLMLLDSAAEGRLMLLSQVNVANVILMLSRQS